MQKKNIITLTTVVLLSAQAVFAQLQLPQPSPKAQVMQTVGLTDITIDYSSPGMKGRSIWGGVVPFDKVWRAGANSATKITFSKDVTIEGVAVPKGSYSIFITPAQSGWTIALNKNATASTDEYKESENIVSIKTFPSTLPYKRERLAYMFSNFTEEQTAVDMEWDNLRATFTVKVATDKQAMDNINNAVASAWRNYASSARYLLEHKGDLNQALAYANQSVAIAGSEWYNTWILATVQAEMKDYKNAYAHAQRAKELGDKNPQGFFFKDLVEKALVDWKPLADAAGGKKKK